MTELVGVELESIRLGVFAEDQLPARVEKGLRSVADDRRLSLVEPVATPATTSHPLGMLATGPVIWLSFDLFRLPLKVLSGLKGSIIHFRAHLDGVSGPVADPVQRAR